MTVAKKTAETRCEKEHDFALVLRGIADLSEKVENALFEAGCDDATLSMRSGQAVLTFSRMAPSYKDAVLSAIKNVREARIGADVLRVDECNLVTLADIARKISRSRQLVHQYRTGSRGPGGFPSPSCFINDQTPLWAWCEVAYWLLQNDLIKEEDSREAEEAFVINVLLDFLRTKKDSPDLTSEVLQAMTGMSE